MKFPWKSGFLKTPANINQSLGLIATDLVLIAGTKKIPITDIERGLYAHLGLRAENGFAISSGTILPPVEVGKWSKRNVEGYEIKRTDLPKITKTFTWETPNFGDGSTYGYHMHSQNREVYQRHFFEPRMLEIDCEVLNDGAGRVALIKFSVAQLLDRKGNAFDNDLLLFLNLLQENTGVNGVYASNASKEDFIGTVALDWDIFPPGTADQVIARLNGGKRPIDIDKEKQARARFALFDKLQPESYLRGEGTFGSYFGALYADDLIVFENLAYGNALYILYNDWADVSKRSRLELLKGTDANYDRFLHVDGWQKRFLAHMRIELNKRGKRLPRRLR